MRKAAGTKRSKASKARLASAGTRKPARRTARAGEPASSPLHAPAAASIELPAECTLRDAAALKSLLLGAAPSAAGITLEGAAVARIDTAVLQLLVALARREQAAGRRMTWGSASPQLCEASATLGLSDVLQLPARAGEPA